MDRLHSPVIKVHHGNACRQQTSSARSAAGPEMRSRLVRLLSTEEESRRWGKKSAANRKTREKEAKKGRWKVEGVSQERFAARGQSARRTGLFQEQSVNPH